MQMPTAIRLIWPVLLGAAGYPLPVNAQTSAAAAPVPAYIGTYTGVKSKGIYLTYLDVATGSLSVPELAVETASPSFLAFHPSGRFVYSVGETVSLGERRAGAVSAFSRDLKSGRLTLLNHQPSGGVGPCHLAVDHSGKCLLVANYGSGSIAALPIRVDGTLGEPGTVVQHHGSGINPQRQSGPHAHFITVDPANRFALSCDLGLDQVLVYRLDPAKSELVANDPPFAAVKPGSGPRHLAFHPSGRYVFLINEMGSSMVVFRYDARHGTLQELQMVSTIPEGFTSKTTCAEVQVHPSGKFVYGSNRGHDSIAAFSFDVERGALTPLQYQSVEGKTPRHFTLDPSGKWLLVENQDSDNVVVLRVDLKTGLLSSTGRRISAGVPVCLVFPPK